MEATKICTECHKTKPLAEFHKNRSAKDGLRSWCKSCVAVRNRKYYAENREKFRAYRRKRREERRANNLLYLYNISLTDYEWMLEDQDNGCAICGRTPTENSRRLCVDHDHDTGEVRGLLCDRCNKLLGLVQDNSTLLHNAASYLAAPKGTIET